MAPPRLKPKLPLFSTPNSMCVRVLLLLITRHGKKKKKVEEKKTNQPPKPDQRQRQGNDEPDSSMLDGCRATRSGRGGQIPSQEICGNVNRPENIQYSICSAALRHQHRPRSLDPYPVAGGHSDNHRSPLGSLPSAFLVERKGSW